MKPPENHGSCLLPGGLGPESLSRDRRAIRSSEGQGRRLPTRAFESLGVPAGTKDCQWRLFGDSTRTYPAALARALVPGLYSHKP